MNDSRLLEPIENTSSPGKRPGVVESALKKMFTRRARVDSIEELNSKFRLITLSGDELKNVSWTPGDKVQIQLGGWVQRTYTPCDWNSEKGRFRILAYLHADGPGTRWARGLRAGDACVLFGPRKSIDLTQLRLPAIFFGDETSLGLAWALKEQKAQSEGIKFLFEFSTSSEPLEVIEPLGHANISHCFRSESTAHASDLEAQMRVLLSSHHPAQFVLTGKSSSAQLLHKQLKREKFSSSQIQARAYWAPGKAGLD